MTLLELSAGYQESALRIRTRMSELRRAVREQTDPDAIRKLQRRLAELTPLLQEAHDLTRHTAHYYDRSYHKHEKYSL